jgi:hypothetical protein
MPATWAGRRGKRGSCNGLRVRPLETIVPSECPIVPPEGPSSIRIVMVATGHQNRYSSAEPRGAEPFLPARPSSRSRMRGSLFPQACRNVRTRPDPRHLGKGSAYCAMGMVAAPRCRRSPRPAPHHDPTTMSPLAVCPPRARRPQSHNSLTHGQSRGPSAGMDFGTTSAMIRTSGRGPVYLGPERGRCGEG